MKTEYVYNINSPVRVKLTAIGLGRYADQMRDLNVSCRSSRSIHGMSEDYPEFPLTPKTDSEGYYHTSMWALMQDFGDLINIGCQLPFETEILIEAKDLS